MNYYLNCDGETCAIERGALNSGDVLLQEPVTYEQIVAVTKELNGLAHDVHLLELEMDNLVKPDIERLRNIEKALGGWVGVEDKPEQNRRVIVLLDNGCVEDHVVFYGDGTFRYIDQITKDITPHVVKWQYLPSPPKETT